METIRIRRVPYQIEKEGARQCNFWLKHIFFVERVIINTQKRLNCRHPISTFLSSMCAKYSVISIKPLMLFKISHFLSFVDFWCRKKRDSEKSVFSLKRQNHFMRAYVTVYIFHHMCSLCSL